jgi:hypothetical protein
MACAKLSLTGGDPELMLMVSSPGGISTLPT